MHKNKTANCKLIKNIETKVATELKLVKKRSSELLEVQQTNNDAVLKVIIYFHCKYNSYTKFRHLTRYVTSIKILL